MSPSSPLPRCLPPCMNVEIVRGDQIGVSQSYHQNNAPLPFQNSDIFELRYEKRQQLCQGEDIRPAFEVTFVRNEGTDPKEFEPGEAIGIICPNVPSETEKMLNLLNLQGHEILEVSALDNDNARRRFKQFGFIPKQCTVRQLFTSILDLRTVLKKTFIKNLGDCCPSGSDDQKVLYNLSSLNKEDYRKDVLENRMMIFDLLERFPSCTPDIAVLIENLSRLAPRFYSISNHSSQSLKIIYKPIVFHSQGKILQGQCSEYLESFHRRTNQSIAQLMDSLNLNETNLMKCYLRKNVRKFSFPKDITVPFAFICHGTGVAPFEAYMEWFIKNQPSGTKSKAVLFYGCRYLERDNLVNLIRAKEIGVETILMQSRADPKRGYVQAALSDNKDKLIKVVEASMGEILICGDYQTMVQQTLDELKIVVSESIVQRLVESERIKIDVWT